MTTATPTKPAKGAALKANTGKASTAVALKKPNTSLVSIADIKAQLLKQREGLAGRLTQSGGIKIRATQDKMFVLPDGTKTPGPLELVIVDFIAVKEFYENGFDKDNIVPPGCFSVNRDPRKMFPMGNVPNKQYDDCQSCPMNVFGTAPNGKAKACKDGRLLAVLPPDSDANTPLWLLQLSSTACGPFDGYVAGVARSHQAMPIEVVTTISFDPNQTYAAMVCSDPQPNPNLAEHFARQDEAKEMFAAERDVSGWVDPDAGTKKPAAKKVAARR
jgi:hypothetical protein